MATGYINNWIKRIENDIHFWFTNYPTGPSPFLITPLPGYAIVNPRVLSHRITSCCPTPPKPVISFAHFPEPYYGNPDDSVPKSAVILFYNPGPSGPLQLLGNTTPGSFHNNYTANGNNYFSLSSAYDFCTGTITKFIIPKTKQVNNLFDCLIKKPSYLKPLFMDLIPWHSDKFQGLNMRRFTNADTIKEVWENLMFAAILNANNTAITYFLNDLKNKKDKIILFCIGSFYQTILPLVGFEDISNHIPAAIPHTIFINPTLIGANGSSKRIKVWKLSSTGLENKIKDLDNSQDLKSTLSGKGVYIINMWTTARSMDIPSNICPTILHILNNL